MKNKILLNYTSLFYVALLSCLSVKAAPYPTAYQVYAQGSNTKNFATRYDGKGHVYLCGQISLPNSIKLKPSATAILLNKDTGSIYLIKCDTALNIVWIKTFGTGEVRDMQIDNSGNVFVGVYFYNSADFDPDKNKKLNLTSVTGTNALLKYNTDGNLMWGFAFGTANSGLTEGINRIAPDNSGGVYAGGWTKTADMDPGPGVQNAVSGFVVKYDTDGKYVFHRILGGINAVVSTLKATPTNVIVAGNFKTQLNVRDGLGAVVATYEAGQDRTHGFVAEYSSTGNYIRSCKVRGGSYISISDILINGTTMYIQMGTQDSMFLDIKNGTGYIDNVKSGYLASYKTSDWSYTGKYFKFSQSAYLYTQYTGMNYNSSKNLLIVNAQSTVYVLDATSLASQNLLMFSATLNLGAAYAVSFGKVLFATGYSRGEFSQLGLVSPPILFTTTDNTAFFIKYSLSKFALSAPIVSGNSGGQVTFFQNEIKYEMNNGPVPQTATLVDLSGRVVYRSSLTNGANGVFTLKMPNNVTDGMYVLNISDKHGSRCISPQKIYIQQP